MSNAIVVLIFSLLFVVFLELGIVGRIYGIVITSILVGIPPLSIAGGHPAKVFNKRGSKNYFSLKEQGKFH